MATASLSKNRTTPGVYITEIPAFGNSVVGVATAVPIFVGYTEFAVNPDTQKPAYMTAVALTSMMDYSACFGGGFDAQYEVLAQAAGATGAPPIDFLAQASSKAADGSTTGELVLDPSGTPTTTAFSLSNTTGVGYHLYMAMRLFFANGGSNCYVVSVKDYWGGNATGPQATGTATSSPSAPASADLLDGLGVAANTRGPTMIVVPSACALSSGYADVVKSMLDQAGGLQDRVAIIDLPSALDPASWTSMNNEAFWTQRTTMAEAVSTTAQSNTSYGAAYGPALQTTIYGLSDLDYRMLSGTQASVDWLNNILTTQAKAMYASDSKKCSAVQSYIAQAFPASEAAAAGTAMSVQTGTSTASSPTTASGVQTLSNTLLNALPVYGQILTAAMQYVNAAAPSGAMAGIWATNDASRGVWNAPANMGVALTSQPKVMITDAQQGAYNVPLDGYSVSILRAMPSRGVVVWGARTLDGNSNDFRYVQVRRTLIYVEQSIKAAIQPFVFAANDAATWISVTSMISNFLTNLWQAGGLMGSKPNEAFTVNCGLGSTMSGQDVLNGYMIVAVSLSLIRPAEFIELTFTQTMQGT
jgi:uncharacterized protein